MINNLKINKNSKPDRFQITQTPSEWLIFKASSNSGWDTCAFTLVKFDPSYIQELYTRIETFDNIEKEPNIYNVAYWDGPFNWFANSNESEIEQFVCDSNKVWAFLEVSDNDKFKNFQILDQRIYGEQMRVFSNGYAQFKGYGKHTSEEFWSYEFPLKEILDLISQS